MDKRGRKEYIQVLRLLETFSISKVEHAIGQAHHLGVLSFDAIKHLVLCAIERRPPKLDLTLYPYLPSATVCTTDAGSYLSLLSGAATIAQHNVERALYEHRRRPVTRDHHGGTAGAVSQPLQSSEAAHLCPRI
ncbi:MULTISPECIES: hypothetical protein [unclassified Undibacterium]|uniref:hypothetical protein n=1 Tax=unclassified Undibacterium TaxID=2630295 RepID=UPI0033913216